MNRYRLLGILMIIALLIITVHSAFAASLLQTSTSIDPSIPTVQLWVMVSVTLTSLVGLFLRTAPTMNDWLKRGIVVLIAVGMTIAGLYFDDGSLTTDLADLGRTVLVVFLGAAGLYSVLVKPLAENVQGVRAITVEKANPAIVVDPGH